MTECKSCGRDSGHWIGCVEARPAQPDPLAAPMEALGFACAYDDCKNPKRPKSKGRAPMYCEEHSDPKNRK